MDLPSPPTMRLDGRRALIAGGSSGIGLGCAVALADAGADVVCAARRPGLLTEAVTALGEAGYRASALLMDVGDPGSICAALAAQAPFDIVVNSAGTARHAAALDTSAGDYQAVMDVNVRGAYFLAVETARAMIAAGRPGSIIQISSQMGHVGGLDRTVYCASKHAVEGMVKAMAIEWAPHRVRVNSVCPTFIRTPLAEATLANPERLQWLMSKIKLGRIGEVQDVAGAVLYLAGDAASLVTGSSIVVDGGWTAG